MTIKFEPNRANPYFILQEKWQAYLLCVKQKREMAVVVLYFLVTWPRFMNIKAAAATTTMLTTAMAAPM